LRDLANERWRFSDRRLFILLRRKGEASGVNRIYRLYREERLTVHERRTRLRDANATRANADAADGQCVKAARRSSIRA